MLSGKCEKFGNEIDALELETRALDERIHSILLELPNLPLADVPMGLSEEENVVVRQWGEPKGLDFPGKPHWDLAEELGIIDFQRGVKLSGSRFYTMSGYGAKLERATISWMLDLHTREHGYTELMLPILVRREVMEGSGNLPKFADNLYWDAEDDLWLIPTAEVPITNLYRDEILPPTPFPVTTSPKPPVSAGKRRLQVGTPGASSVSTNSTR